jgi:hypothetical protein
MPAGTDKLLPVPTSVPMLDFQQTLKLWPDFNG